MENSVFFCVEKSGIFVGRPVLDSGRDSGTARDSGRDSGQRDCPVRDNGTLDGPSCTGQRRLGTVDSGRDRVDRSTVLTLEY